MNGIRNQQRTAHRQSFVDDFGAPSSTETAQQGGWSSTAHYFRPIYDDTDNFEQPQPNGNRQYGFPVSGRQSVPVPSPNRSSYFEDQYRSRPIYNPIQQRETSEFIPQSVPSAHSALNGFPRFQDDTHIGTHSPPSSSSTWTPPKKHNFRKIFFRIAKDDRQASFRSQGDQ